MRFKKILQMYEDGNVCVCGMRGRGKDMLTANVIARRKKPYISNFDYKVKGAEWQPLDFNKLDCGKNDYRNFISGNINYYEFPYIKGSDIYLSDAGIYMPSQFCSELNREYKYLPTFSAISRHFGSNFNFNVQSINRVWDKFREMGDFFIRCRKCIVIPTRKYFGGELVIQLITIYDKYQSCVDRVKPNKLTIPITASAETRNQYNMYCDKFENQYGKVKNAVLIYINKSDYDTHYFDTLLKGGKKYER